MPTRGPRRTCPPPRRWSREVEDAELFLYPGSGHLFADSSVDDYDEKAAGLLKERTFAFLDRVG